MTEKLINLLLGSLLHDIGKIIHRTDVMKNHSYLGWEFLSEISPFKGSIDIKECIKYHHGRDLVRSNVNDSSLAYITYMADNISASGDRRLIEGDEVGNIENERVLFDKRVPLASVFNILNGRNEDYVYRFGMIDKINYPIKGKYGYSAGDYLRVKIKLKEQLEGIEINSNYINSVLHLLETTTSFIPSSTYTRELGDISFFDHSKTTAAIASCLYYYLKNENDLKTILFKNEKEFWKEDVFLLYTYDISGIQNYIYTISGTEALKSLRARSLYLELLLENIVDQLLQELGLSRCNLIYTGGGHAYILLPNTVNVKDTIACFEEELKSWFLNEFDTSLYIASGCARCNSNELSTDVGRVYERVGRDLAINKTRRYTADDIIKLNSTPKVAENRECRECKRTGPVNKEDKCIICQALIEISPQITKQETFFVVLKENEKSTPSASLPLPFSQILTIKEIDQVRGKEYVRIYSKNQPSMGYNFATNLWVGDYSISSRISKGVKTFGELANEATGINRIAVLRADVDDLSKTFVSGFKEQKDGKIIENSKKQYETISRTATLSRQLSMFFKFYINEILEEKQRNALIVYSGGDDMFIVGSWNEVIDLAKDIRNAFNLYTQGTLTLSAGIGIYFPTYPISRIASEVGDLESAAKTKDKNKNKVTLFKKGRFSESRGFLEEDWILEWDQLPILKGNRSSQIEENNELNIFDRGIEGKLRTLRQVFYKDEQHGKTFLYKILDLIRESQKDRINIARYAYILERAKQKNNRLNISQFYKYIKNPGERKEFEIAITLYSYETRN